MILNNPEFSRNRWLELKPGKMIAAPALLAAIFSITYLAADTREDFFTALRVTAYIALVVAIFILGLKDASESVISEVTNKTWDSQRMTSITPWEMALGKLLGSTVFAWYCGFFCILVILATAPVLPDTAESIKILIVVVLSAVTGQAAALGFSLLGIKKGRSNAELKGSSYFALVLLIAAFFVFGLQAAVSIESPSQGALWYGMDFSRLNFLLFSVSLFLFFSILGLYRNMRVELQYENGPWVWVFFLASLVLYVSGFVSKQVAGGNNVLLIRCYLAYSITLALTYFMALGESKYVIDLKLLLVKIQSRRWNDVQKLAPLWLVTLAVAVVLGVGTLMASLIIDQYVLERAYNTLPLYYPLSLLCFVLRDLTLLLYINLTIGSTRADIVTVLVLMVLYLLVPLFISFTEHAAGMFFFVPLPDETFVKSVLPAAAQFGGVLYLLKNRWETIQKLLP